MTGMVDKVEELVERGKTNTFYVFIVTKAFRSEVDPVQCVLQDGLS